MPMRKIIQSLVSQTVIFCIVKLVIKSIRCEYGKQGGKAKNQLHEEGKGEGDCKYLFDDHTQKYEVPKILTNVNQCVFVNDP